MDKTLTFIDYDVREIPAYYLNRKGDEVRFAHMEKVCQRFGYKKYQRVEGPNDPKKYFGGAIGMCRILELALQKESFEPFIIMEDDCNLTPYYKWEEETSYHVQVPKKTDLLFLGVSRWGIHKINNHNVYELKIRTINENLKQVYNMFSLHAIVIFTRRFARSMMRNMIYAASVKQAWDIPTAKSQGLFNCYALNRPLFYQDKKVKGDQYYTLITFDGFPDSVTTEDAEKIETGEKMVVGNYPFSTDLLIDNPKKWIK